MRGTFFMAFLALVSLSCQWGLTQEVSSDSTPMQPSVTCEGLALPVNDVPAPGPCLFLTGEFLYLRPNRDGLGMALLSNQIAGSGFSSLQSLAWQPTPALRMGIDYRFPDCGVDLGAAFTYFHAKTQRFATAPDGGVLLATLATATAAQEATDADGDAGLSYAIVDLDAGKSVSVNDSIKVRCFGGVRIASIDQALKCVYSGGALGDVTDYVNSPVKFWGAGLTAGAETNWELYRGWGLYGKVRLGLLSGSFQSKQTETLGDVEIAEQSDTFRTLVPLVELGAGLAYQGEHVFFRAGYEVSDWIDMVFGINGAARERSDLTLESLVLKVGFGF